MTEKELIYKDDARAAILRAEPRAAYCIDRVKPVDAVEAPPVKIGDTAYFILQRKIYEAEIVLIRWEQRRYRTDTEIRGLLYGFHSVSAQFSEWGKTVFATNEEAETAIGERRYEDG